MNFASNQSSNLIDQDSAEGLPFGVKVLLCFLGAVFFLEFLATGSFQPRADLLTYIGGTKGELIKQDSIYWLRIFTALYLHGSIIHLISNCIGFLIGGPILEKLIGKYWFWAVFLISGAIGSLFSLFITPSNTVSVGASGGVMGVFSAALLVTNIKVKPVFRKHFNIYFGQALIPSLIPLSRHVDYAAHFGGAIGGILCGLVMMLFWPKEFNHPQGEGISKLLIVIFLIASLASLFLTIMNF
ncbi:MAG: rhomboid family intramembrane serine protease [Candidatus Melainabacteria bacterium]|jgi:rhomboid protease GluP